MANINYAFSADLARETVKAWGVRVPVFEGSRSENQVFWLPKSQCKLSQGLAEVPYWLVQRNTWCQLAIELETGINPML